LSAINASRFGPLARRDDEPTFDEPWQAQVLALAFTLSEAGLFTPVEWSDALGAELRRANERGEPDDHTTYYAAALAALERLVAKDGSVTTGALAERFEEWRSAYLNTPHGQPVELISGTRGG
jgi:nitrile hydratase accessory protein